MATTLFRATLSLWTNLCSNGVISDPPSLEGSVGEEEGGEEMIDFFSPSLAQELEGAAMLLSSLDVGGCANILNTEFLLGEVSAGNVLASRLQDHLALLAHLKGDGI